MPKVLRCIGNADLQRIDVFRTDSNKHFQNLFLSQFHNELHLYLLVFLPDACVFKYVKMIYYIDSSAISEVKKPRKACIYSKINTKCLTTLIN
jgi:hypothetical protein